MQKPAAGRVPARRARRRERQASLAVSGDGERWFLINASPDLRQQIEARQILHPETGPALLADRRRHPDRRRCRCDRRAVAPARTPGFHDLRQPARAGRAEGQSDLRRAGRGLRAPRRRCRSASRSSRAMSMAAAAGSRSNCSTCRARSRSTSRPAIVAAGTGGQAGRHGRRRDRARADTGWSTFPVARRMTDGLEAAAGRRVGRAVRRHAVAGRRDDPRAASAPRPASAWGI